MSQTVPGTGDSDRVVGLRAGISAAVVLIVGVACLLGLPSWIALFVCGLPWLVFLSARFGRTLSLVSVVIGELFALLAIMMLTAALHLAMLATLELVFTAVGLLGCLALWRSGVRIQVPRGASLVFGLPALLGGAVWLAVVGLAQVVPGAARISWVMLGDSANNILLMREVLRDSGIAVGSGENPVPLPAGFFAVMSASDRGGVAPSALLAHDIAAMVLTWSILIALTCLAMGLTAGYLTRLANARPVIVAGVSGLCSLLPLSWFVAGYAIEYGFLDALLAIPIALFAFVAYLSRGSHAALSLMVLLLSATLLLAVWSPLVVLPGVLGITVVVRGWRLLVGAGAIAKVVLLLSVIQLVGYVVFVTVPTLLSVGGALATAGAVFSFHNWMTALIAVGAFILAILATSRRNLRALVGLAGVVVAAVIGLGVLLFVSRNQPSPWTYYPLKFWWLCAVIILVLALGFAGAAIARRVPGLPLQLVAVVLVAAATVGFLAWTPSAQPGYGAVNPVSRVLAARSHGTGDAVADRILRYTTPEQSVVFWHSGDPAEGSINFWAWEMWAGTLKGKVALRTAAYGAYNEKSVTDLCRVVGLLGGGTNVYSTTPTLQSQLDATCPQRHARVILQGTK